MILVVNVTWRGCMPNLFLLLLTMSVYEITHEKDASFPYWSKHNFQLVFDFPTLSWYSGNWMLLEQVMDIIHHYPIERRLELKGIPQSGIGNCESPKMASAIWGGWWSMISGSWRVFKEKGLWPLWLLDFCRGWHPTLFTGECLIYIWIGIYKYII